MKRYVFHLSISPEAYLEYYRGAARSVVAKATTGQTVQFPASMLQRYVTQDGIHGAFVLTCDENNKMVGFERLQA